jgi:hypothetical protein
MSEKSYKTPALIAAGFAIGTIGVKILSSREAKTCYTHATAAGIRGKEWIMSVYDRIRANCDDIYEDAKVINEVRDAEDVIADASETVADAAEEILA